MPNSPGQAPRPPASECSRSFRVASLLRGGGAALGRVLMGGARALVMSAVQSCFLLPSFPQKLLNV